MRKVTILNLLVAGLLAVLAVVAIRTWLETERRQMNSQTFESIETRPISRVVVASSSLRFGERITSDKLQTIEWPTEKIPVGMFASIPDIIGDGGDEEARYVLSAIDKDEPVHASKMSAPGERAKLSTVLSPNMKAVSIRVNDVLGVAGFVLPGDRVDILLTRTERSAEGSRSYVDVLLQGVKVLAIDQTADDRKDQPSVVRTVTFEVTTEEAQKLTLSASVGTLSLALRHVANEFEESRRVTLSDLGGGELSAALAQEWAKIEEERKKMAEQLALEEQKRSEQETKLQGLEDLMKSVGEDLKIRLDEVETSLTPQESSTTIEESTVAIEEEPAIVEEEVTQPVLEPKQTYFTINVIRSGRRQEYRIEVE